jgi:hypothetical protein
MTGIIVGLVLIVAAIEACAGAGTASSVRRSTPKWSASVI